MIAAFVSVVALLAAGALAECPNACSGQGDCGTKDQCTCYVGFYGGDCSLRVCPVGTAFVDTPLGDLSHQGVVSRTSYSKVQWSQYLQPEVWPTSSALGGWSAQPGEAHFAVECSGKGTCDRTLGVCGCYDGFTGAACQRTTCPNSCSGHGICYTVGSIASGQRNSQVTESSYGELIYSGVTTAVDYRLWDADKNTACVCDTGYSGIDCSLRTCPRGDDPLTTDPYTCGTSACRNELQSFSVDGGQTGGVYALVFTDLDGSEYTTADFKLSTDSTSASWSTIKAENEATIKGALQALPNNVVGTVAVTAAVSSDANPLYNHFYYSSGGSSAKEQLRFTVEFLTKSGDLPSMELKYNRVANPATGASFLFGPGKPVQNLVLNALTTGSSTEYIQFKIFPTDQTLFSLDTYWVSSIVQLGLIQSSNAFVLAVNIAQALNSIPAIQFSYGAPFVASGTVISYVDTVGSVERLTAKIAFPDAVTGFNAIQFRRAVGTTPPAFTDATPWTTVEILVQDNINGNKEAAVCANRGLCDYATGLCSCFAGHTGVDCSQQSALAHGSVTPSGPA